MTVAASPPPPRTRRARLGNRLPGTSRLRPLAATDRASTVDHLEELRWRLVACISLLVTGFVTAYALQDMLFDVLNAPLDGRFEVQTLSVTEPFFTTITVAANAAFIVTFPALVYNGYRYLAPALDTSQRRRLIPLIVASPALFLGGVAFCYFFVLGPAVRFLLGIGTGHFDVAVRAQEYYSFVSMTLLCMGLVFQFPIVLLALSRLGILTASWLRANRRIAFLGVAVLAALLPTADPVSLVIEMLPLLVLFEASIWLVALQERRAARAGTGSSLPPDDSAATPGSPA